MKAALQFLFLLFYVASSLAAKQIQTVWVVRDILQFISSSNDPRTLDQAPESANPRLARYRDAKKATNDFQYRNTQVSSPALAITADELVAASEFFQLPPRVDRHHPRAPPIAG
jgi:hypothetical protein